MASEAEWKLPMGALLFPEEEQRVEKNWLFLTKRSLNSQEAGTSKSKLKPQGFSRAERLRSKHEIDLLFLKGQTIKTKNLKLIYLLQPNEDAKKTHQGIFSAPKRQFPKAFERNKRKRHLREAYRLNKQILFDRISQKNKYCTFIFIYLSQNLIPFERLSEEIGLLLKKIKDAG